MDDNIKVVNDNMNNQNEDKIEDFKEKIKNLSLSELEEVYDALEDAIKGVKASIEGENNE